MTYKPVLTTIVHMNLLTMSIADKKYNTMKAIVILNLKYPITGN